MTPIIQGLILAGGQGRRMGGRDKGLLEVNGKTFVEHTIDALIPQVKDIIISANRNIMTYQRYGYPVVNDENYQYQGPLAGILTALQYQKQKGLSPWLVCVPCDAWQIPTDLVARFSAAVEINPQQTLFVAHDGQRLQPLHALIHQNQLPVLQNLLDKGQKRVMTWIESQQTIVVNFTKKHPIFDNINEPEALAKITRNQ